MSLIFAICTSISYQSGALLLSILLEAIAAGILGRYWLDNPIKLAVVATGATLITHPFVWLLFAVGEEYLSYGLRLVLIETAVIEVEAIAFYWVMHYSIVKSLGLSLVVNGVSLLLGRLVLYLFSC
jgi:hypothetical protein